MSLPKIKQYLNHSDKIITPNRKTHSVGNRKIAQTSTKLRATNNEQVAKPSD